jgi:hypothetical protein
VHPGHLLTGPQEEEEEEDAEDIRTHSSAVESRWHQNLKENGTSATLFSHR